MERFRPPKRYRNEFGQLLEHSPYCERDLRPPTELPVHSERGEFEVRVKVNGEIMTYVYDFHPLDVVGWDGYLYPYAFNISRLRAHHRPCPPAAAGPPDL